MLLKCVNYIEAKRIMHEVHEGICGAHKSNLNMRWWIHKYGYYWPTTVADYVAYIKSVVKI